MPSLLHKIFGQKDLPDFSALHTDMHSHILPGIDDGSQSPESSVNMMTGLMELGFKKFITTPHIMPEVFNNTPESVHAAFSQLKNALENKDHFDLHVAGEYYIDDHFATRVRNGEQFLTFGDNYILVEVSMMVKEKKLEESLFELVMNGYKPVLAHAERYPYMFENGKLNYYSGLCDADVFLQVNLRSFTGNYGEIQRKIARALAENDMISFLGTDLHNEGQLGLLFQAMKDNHVQKLMAGGKLLNHTI